MIYPELLRTEIEKGYLTLVLKEQLTSSEAVENALADFEKVYIPDLGGIIKGLVKDRDRPDFEKQFLLSKRKIFEHQAWLDLFVELVMEVQPSAYEPCKIGKRKQKALASLDKMLKLLKPLETKLLALRKKRLRKNSDQEISSALKKIEALLKNSPKLADAQEKQVAQIVKNQELIFKSIVLLFQSQFDKWEKLILKNGRGFLYSDPARLPFSAIYTMYGDFYIILEVMGHLLGYGFGKLACRAVHLQSGQIFALIKSRMEYPDITDPTELKEKIEKNFLFTWREADTLKHLHNKLGVVQIREQMAFQLKEDKQLFLVEDYFADGDLEKYLRHLIDKKTTPPTFEQAFQIGFQLLTALKSIHQEGYIHFDIKPDNILIDFHNYPHFMASIADFNCAKAYHDTLSYSYIGHSTQWCPPEYVHFRLHEENKVTPKPVGPLVFRFDVWSMGLVFYFLYFREYFPWIKQTEDETYQTIAHLKEGWIPERFQKHVYYPLIKKMLEPDPHKRLTSAEALDLFMEISKKAAAKTSSSPTS